MTKEIKIKDIIKGWLDNKELPKKFIYFNEVYKLSKHYINENKSDLDRLYYNHMYCRYFDFTSYSDKEETVIIEEDILDEKEKIYLSSIIKPFRKRIKYITKEFWDNSEYIIITMKHFKYNCNDIIMLPYFEKDSMYKDMELNKDYTLKELGL